jgi:hypothetical protein
MISSKISFMKKHFLKLLVLVTLLFCLASLSVQAQIPNRTPGQFPNSNNTNDPNVLPATQNEVTGEADKTKKKSNDPNYDSKGKGGFVSEFVRWYNENAPFKPQPIPLQNPAPSGHGGSSFQDFANDYPLPDVSTPVNKNYYFSYGIGVGIADRGGKFKYPDGNATENILYAQIPVMVRYSYIISNGATLFAQAGPYYGIALSGSYKDNTGKTKLKFGNGVNDDYRIGDYGLKFGIGYKLQTQPIFIALAADLGLRNMTPGGDNKVKIKNQSFGLQVGYIF